MNIRPVGRKLLVMPLPHEEETMPSGIIMPETAMADLSRGEVIEVSEEIKHLYKPGDIILFPSKAGIGQLVNGAIHFWLDSRPETEQIWGIVIPEKHHVDKEDNI